MTVLPLASAARGAAPDSVAPRRIAVVGAGIAGLGAAWLLARDNEVVVYEAGDRAGGHANTVEVELPSGPGRAAGGPRRIAVDTGFIVYNERNYPNLIRLFDALGVETAASDMSFSFSADDGAFEYAGSLGGLFAQRVNFLRPRTWRLLRDILRFYREAPALLDAPAAPGEPEPAIGDWLAERGYSRVFVEEHLMPMAAAIWSSPLSDVRRFPLRSFLRFFRNHGLLQAADRPRWRTVAGGSRRYVERIAAELGPRLRLSTPVVGLERRAEGVLLRDANGGLERFDEVVLACHGDQALAILGSAAAEDERALLENVRFQPNRAILHSDPALMPKRRAVWASWNYLSAGGVAPGTDGSGAAGDPGGGRDRAVSVTYWMNRLQPIDPAVPLFVSLNPLKHPDPALVHGRFDYDHPLLDDAAIAAQRALPGIQGRDRVWFCGAWCGYGFHEDGLEAGFAVAEALGSPAPWAGSVVPASPAAANAAPAQRLQAAE